MNVDHLEVFVCVPGVEDRSGSPGYKAFRKNIPKAQCRLLPFSGKLSVVDTKASGRWVDVKTKGFHSLHLQNLEAFEVNTFFMTKSPSFL